MGVVKIQFLHNSFIFKRSLVSHFVQKTNRIWYLRSLMIALPIYTIFHWFPVQNG